MKYLLLFCLVIALAGVVGPGGWDDAPVARGIVEDSLSERRDDAPAGAFNVAVRDQYGQPVPGAVVQFCDTACQLYTTDSEGLICFTGRPARYNIHVVSVPEGYSCDASQDAVCDGSGEWVIVEVVKAQA